MRFLTCQLRRTWYLFWYLSWYLSYRNLSPTPDLVPIWHLSPIRITFLSAVSQKAALAPDLWRSGAKFEAFTAKVFGEHE